MKKIFTLAIVLLIAENSYAIGFPTNNVYVHHKLKSQKAESKQEVAHNNKSGYLEVEEQKSLSIYKEKAKEDGNEGLTNQAEERMSLLQVVGAFIIQVFIKFAGIRF